MSATSSLGNETAFTTFTFVPTGLQVQTAVDGDSAISAGSVVVPTGVAGTGGIATLVIWGRIIPSTSNVWTEVAA